jgi:phytoene synthase
MAVSGRRADPGRTVASDLKLTLAAYRHCESVTRAQAANFYYGIRLLPPPRRRAMCAVYAFARRVDDIGDGPLPREEKLRRLDVEAAALSALGASGLGAPAGADPVLAALADAHARFALPQGALGELIDGVRMDVDGVAYERFDDLVLYCRRVAGAIGRVCLAIFDTRTPAHAGERAPDRIEAEKLADDLGVALQLTNILRDVREDAENGRVYLPAEDLRRFGLIAAGEEERAPAVLVGIAHGQGGELEWLQALIRFEGARAQTWFRRGLALGSTLDRRSAACVLAMAGIYRRLLDRIEADPARALHERISLPASEKAWVAARSVLASERRSFGKALGWRA